ncbi:conserved hypothetical protein [uncultured Alphaproteobacteria bacterium]|uniref:Uncharacterized protein n=1 Tax=uncultured Alphaproteobacteria bacterium TaxID=91750 RepID=A0A212J3S1_9PROT|nr:conserved hypothetical protein [uncultured Alphaproteobacteria bacterium]
MPSEGTIVFTPEHMQNVRQLLCRCLNVYVGPGRLYPVEVIASGIGTSADTVRRWLRGESCPEWPNLSALLAILPPEFANALLAPAGLTGARRIDGESTHGETLREITEAAATLAAALADGRIDHTERPKVVKELTEAMVAISQWLAKEGNA